MIKFISIFSILLITTIAIESAPFSDNGNGTVTDTGTKLIWQKCTEGQDVLTCEGEAAQMNYSQANIYCANLQLANKKWRLPKREEIFGLLDLTSKDEYSKIDTSVFPKTVAYRFWSSTPTNSNETVMWTTHFYYGEEKRTKKIDKGYARCVAM